LKLQLASYYFGEHIIIDWHRQTRFGENDILELDYGIIFRIELLIGGYLGLGKVRNLPGRYIDSWN